eukprot:14959722-Alexandrium_andersonii.AAC.1
MAPKAIELGRITFSDHPWFTAVAGGLKTDNVGRICNQLAQNRVAWSKLAKGALGCPAMDSPALQDWCKTLMANEARVAPESRNPRRFWTEEEALRRLGLVGVVPWHIFSR